MTRPVLIQRRYFQFFIPWLLPLIFAQADFSISPFHYRIWDSGDEMSQNKSEEEDTCFLKIKQSSRCLFNTSWWEAPVGCADPTSRRRKAKTSPSLDPPWIPVGRRFTVLPLWVSQMFFFLFFFFSLAVTDFNSILTIYSTQSEICSIPGEMMLKMQSLAGLLRNDGSQPDFYWQKVAQAKA